MELIDDERGPIDLRSTPVHLGLGSRARPVDGFAWDPAVLAAYAEAVADDGAEGRMVMIYAGDGLGDHWEAHPAGDELVVCLDGTIAVTRERDGTTEQVVLGPGQATINPAGVWHVVDHVGSARLLTVTAGLGTRHEPRDEGPAASAGDRR
jgi:mannose-6-phosphate isomerase-like protein (cupin superfamily)